ncbi:DUF455 family protein [Ectothiorhodospiraceae bacterium BW-2]|nr:DUF455 family protein [Ectothiorhodospiraceae bacterium BW-2]
MDYPKLLEALLESEPAQKVAQTGQLWQQWQAGGWRDGEGTSALPQSVTVPGRPERLALVASRDLPRRKPTTPEGRAILLHSLVHIEFNAINLALDAAYRFRTLPAAYLADWLQVAAEEAYHFSLLNSHLNHLGYRYGDYPAHNGLWEMALKTADSPLARMALVPRTLEARGLDVTPTIQTKLRDNGDANAALLLEIIFRDEIGHVAIGNRWFNYLCQQQGLEPTATFLQLFEQYGVSPPRPPFAREARYQAGFSAAELDYLEFGGATTVIKG